MSFVKTVFKPETHTNCNYKLVQLIPVSVPQALLKYKHEQRDYFKSNRLFKMVQ